MADLPGFEDVFGSDPSVAYSPKLAQQISRHRRELDNVLFFDRLLNTMNIEDPSKLYPPHSHNDLRKLYNRISSSSSPPHHKHSLLYYILLDLSIPKRSAVAYARHVFLPSKYATLMDGLWRLDRLDFEDALDSLTAPSLIPTFSEETLMVLARHNVRRTGDPSLVLSYYHTVAPQIGDRKVLDEVFRCMCTASVTEGFFFARQQGETLHRHLFVEMIRFVLDGQMGEVKAERAAEMVGLPMTAEEEDWLEEFLLSHEANGIVGAKDTVLMRRLMTGRLDEAKKLSASIKEERVDGMSWDGLMESLA